MPDTQTTPDYQLPDLQYQLPAAPQFGQTGVGQPTYGSFGNDYTGSQAGVVGAYRNYLGRDPESNQVVQDWASNPNWEQGIMNSPEAQTLGRARNEINPLLNSQQQQVQRDLDLQRQGAQSQINQLNPLYQQQFGELAFGNTQQQNALDTQLQQLIDSYNSQSGQLQEQYTPALLAARQAALRSGFTDASTIAGERIAAGFKPISQGLADLAVKTQTNRNDIQSKKQALQEQYLFGRENLMQKRQTDLQGILDKLNLQQTQAGQQFNQIEAQRAPSIYARGGELGDAQKQYQLQLQALTQQQQLAQAQLAEQQRQFNATPR